MKTYEQYLQLLSANLVKALLGKYDAEHPTIDDKRVYLKSRKPKLDFMVDIFGEERVIAEYRIIMAQEKTESELDE